MKIPGTSIDRATAEIPIPVTHEGTHFGDIKLFCGSAGHELGAEIAKYLNIQAGSYDRKIFSNENIFIRLRESVRGQDVYLIQPISSPIHENLMEMLIMIDALKRDSAWRINVVVPYMAYARSDKKDQPRVPITARLVANMIEVAGADRYMTVDLHSGQIQGFFNIPGDALSAFRLLSDYVDDMNIPDLTVVATDLGFAKRARNWAERLGTPVAIVEKRRVDNAERPEVLSIIGEVTGRNVLLVDDEVNTGASMVNAIHVLWEKDVKDIYVAFTHGFFTDKSIEEFANLDLKKIILTNTIPQPKKFILPNMKILSVGPMLAEVIRRAHLGLSVGVLFDEAT